MLCERAIIDMTGAHIINIIIISSFRYLTLYEIVSVRLSTVSLHITVSLPITTVSRRETLFFDPAATASCSCSCCCWWCCLVHSSAA